MSGDRARPDFVSPLLTPSVATVGALVDPKDFVHGSAMQRASDSLPALQIELCLSENQQELNLLIKHGRALVGSYAIVVCQKLLFTSGGREMNKLCCIFISSFQLIPGSNELPDVYVKVYLLSGRRRKSTKRKTAIIRRSSAPSFNTTVSKRGYLVILISSTNSFSIFKVIATNLGCGGNV